MSRFFPSITIKSSFGSVNALRLTLFLLLLSTELLFWASHLRVKALTPRDSTVTRSLRTKSVMLLRSMIPDLSVSTIALFRTSTLPSGLRLTSMLIWSSINLKVSKIFNIGLNMLLTLALITRFLFMITWTLLLTTILTCGASLLLFSISSTASLSSSSALFAAAAAKEKSLLRLPRSKMNDYF